MALWIPPNSVGKNEHVGRRLFGEVELAGAAGQPTLNRLRLNHFQESRDDEISLDRMGASSVHKSTVGYLRPRGERQAASFSPPGKFSGWVTVRAGIIAAYEGGMFSVVASPITGEPDPLDNNTFHAHAIRPQGLNPKMAALHLREAFETNGHHQFTAHPPPSRRPVKPAISAAAAQEVEDQESVAAPLVVPPPGELNPDLSAGLHLSPAPPATTPAKQSWLQHCGRLLKALFSRS